LQGEGKDHHNHVRYAVIEVQHCSKGELQAFLGTVAKLCQETSVIFEIDAQHDRDAEKVLFFNYVPYLFLIDQIRVLDTIVGGKTVYQAGS
jgi:hypothetical protein